MLLGLFFVQKLKKLILKKRNSMKGLVSVRVFYIKGPINVESHMYKVTKYFSINSTSLVTLLQ